MNLTPEKLNGDMEPTNLTRLIIVRLVPATLAVLAILLFIESSNRPWVIVAANMAVLSLFIYWNARAIKRLDEERGRMLEEIAKAARIRSEFASMVSHELRTPLTVIKESVGLVVEGVDGPITAQQREHLQMADHSVDRLNTLINSVLDFQKIDSGHIDLKMQPVDSNVLIQSLANELQPLVEKKKLQLKLQLSETLPEVMADKEAVRHIVTNLVSNAIKFTDRGIITVSSQPDGEFVKISVKDQGIGIKPEEIDKLFKSFSQIYHEDRRYVGTGLGLVICKKLVDLLGGTIGVTSDYGKGSTFYFTLRRVS